MLAVRLEEPSSGLLVAEVELGGLGVGVKQLAQHTIDIFSTDIKGC